MFSLLVAAALAAPPSTMTHQARLLDANGTPISGTHDVTLSAYASASSSQAEWSHTFEDMAFSDGYFAAPIGPVDVHDYPAGMWVGTAIDGGAELSRTAVQVVPYALSTDSRWPGIRLDAEDVTSDNTSGGAVVADATAHGGFARQSQPGDGSRIWGLHGHEFGGTFTATHARVLVRAKVSDNTAMDAIGGLVCTNYRDGQWHAAGGTGIIRPVDFDAPDTWQDFVFTCAWSWDDADQFIGWDGYVDAGVSASIDYVHIVPAGGLEPVRELPAQVTTRQGTWTMAWAGVDTPIPVRQTAFVKRFEDSDIRVSWHDNFRCYGDEANCRVELRFRPSGGGAWRGCTAPGPVLVDLYQDTGTAEIVNLHQPATILGHCSEIDGQPIAAGNWEMVPVLAQNPHAGEGQFYLGWASTRAVIEVTERRD